jgi:hypothetical protein
VSGPQIGPRFNLIGAIPTTVLVVFVIALLATGAPSRAPDLADTAATLAGISATQIALIAAAGVTLGLITYPLQLALVQTLEGYWSPWALGLFAIRGRERHLARLELYDEMRDALAPKHWWEKDQEWLVKRRRDRGRARLVDIPYHDDHILPTSLGNVLRRAEDLAGDRFGLDAVEVIPRLYPLMPPLMVTMLEDARNQVDMSARFVGVWLAATAFGLVVLASHGLWLIVPVFTYGLAWLSYLACVAAARSYGGLLIRAVDVYRFELVRHLGFDPPKNEDDERDLNELIMNQLSGRRFFLRNDGQPVDPLPCYTHPDMNQEP